MEKEIEISKNAIISFLTIFGIVITLSLGFAIIMHSNTNSNLKNAINKERLAKESALSRIWDLEIENGNLVMENDSLEDSNLILKKKVNFYFEFYRKNQPLNLIISSGKNVIPLNIRFKQIK